jgi:hypothetical protein
MVLSLLPESIPMVMLLSNVVTPSSISTSTAPSFIIVVKPVKEKSAESLFTRLAQRLSPSNTLRKFRKTLSLETPIVCKMFFEYDLYKSLQVPIIQNILHACKSFTHNIKNNIKINIIISVISFSKRKLSLVLITFHFIIYLQYLERRAIALGETENVDLFHKRPFSTPILSFSFVE